MPKQDSYRRGSLVLLCPSFGFSWWWQRSPVSQP